MLAIVIVAFIIVNPLSVMLKPQPEEPEPQIYDLRISWWYTNKTYNLKIHRMITLDVVNYHTEPFNVTRVELIYKLDETLRLADWECFNDSGVLENMEHFTLEPNGTEGCRKQLRSDFSPNTNPSEERVAFFNLVLDERWNATDYIRAEVETDKAIFFYDTMFHEDPYHSIPYFGVIPTRMEEK